jgi:tetratricopeptide (TPR) repeat protein
VVFFISMGMSPRVRAVLLLVALTTVAPTVAAQSTDLGNAAAADARAAARAAATSGFRAYSEGRYADAMTLFAKAQALVHAPTHLLYYARSSAKLGKLVQANEAYLKILRESLPPNAPKAFVDAQAAAQTEQPQVDQRLPRLTIVVTGNESKQAKVTVNGVEVSQALLGIAAPHDPGDLELEAVAPGWRSRKTTITLKESDHQTVKLALDVRDATAAPASALAAAPEPRASKTGLKVAGWITVALGVGGLGAGTYFVVDNRNNRDAANALCNLPNGVCPSSQRAAVESFDSAANTSEVLAWVSYGVGGAAVVAGAVMLILSRGGSEAPPAKTAEVHPWLGFGSAGLAGSF